MAESVFPPKSAVIRQAAELLAFHDAMHAARRTVSLKMAFLAHKVVILLMQAQGRSERFDTAPPASFFGRPMTLYVRSNRGHPEALLAPTSLSKDTAAKWLDEGNAGFFHRPEDWADTRYYDAFSVFWTPSSWNHTPDPVTGIVAWAAYAAKTYGGLDDTALRELVIREGGPTSFAWSQALLEEIRAAAGKVEVPDREPPYIPTRILPFTAERGLGWGEGLAFWLYADVAGPNLSAKQVGRMLGVDEPAQVRKMARVAGRKLRVDSVMRLVPAWPKESTPITIKDPKDDVPSRKGGER